MGLTFFDSKIIFSLTPRENYPLAFTVFYYFNSNFPLAFLLHPFSFKFFPYFISTLQIFPPPSNMADVPLGGNHIFLTIHPWLADY